MSYQVRVTHQWVSFERGAIDVISTRIITFRWRWVARLYCLTQVLLPPSGSPRIGCHRFRAELIE